MARDGNDRTGKHRASMGERPDDRCGTRLIFDHSRPARFLNKVATQLSLSVSFPYLTEEKLGAGDPVA